MEPGLRGFTRRNLFRMRQFYEAYREDKKVSPLVTQLPWSHHLIILGQSKRPKEREFYVRLAIQERRHCLRVDVECRTQRGMPHQFLHDFEFGTDTS
jgi:predicted nuclease of restriction endonuclease-like (RecB) superfamily